MPLQLDYCFDKQSKMHARMLYCVCISELFWRPCHGRTAGHIVSVHWWFFASCLLPGADRVRSQTGGTDAGIYRL